jgi:beta-glucanase (GH16 family)
VRRAASAWALTLTALFLAGSVGVAVANPARPDRAATLHRVHPKWIFHDEFVGGKLNAAKWNNGWFGDGVHPTKAVNGAGDACNDPAQVSVGGGQLTITASKRACLGYPWASGLINTNGKFAFTTGTVEIGIWLPGSTRVDDWPTAWSNGQHWPNDGEIDLVEGLGGHGAWHVHSTGPTVGGGNLGPGYHVVKYVRTTSTVTVFYDGVQVGSASTSRFANSPHYLILELAVSKSISPPEVAAQVHYDFVRVTAATS